MDKNSDSGGSSKKIINLKDVAEVKATRFNDWLNVPKKREESKMGEAFILSQSTECSV